MEPHASALPKGGQTQKLELAEGAISRVGGLFRELFPRQAALLVADTNTWLAAGRQTSSVLTSSAVPVEPPLVFDASRLLAEQRHVDRIETLLRSQPNVVPVAVGSGTINDLTKLAAHNAGRKYLCVATAASMDGYAAFGASITRQGAKSTFACPAPVAVVADVDIITSAPACLAVWGYADLLAKVTSGADWLIADALGVEPIHPEAWALVQAGIRQWVSNPDGISRREPRAILGLMQGLLSSGFAMQVANSSRPASGAEHQFSHLWDMQHHTFDNEPVPHGLKVGVALLAVAELYEALLDWPIHEIDVEACCGRWLSLSESIEQARDLLEADELVRVAQNELSAKYVNREQLRAQLSLLRRGWPELRNKLRRQLLPPLTLKRMLQSAGAPVDPEQIGISRDRLRTSFWQAYYIRRRFTVLDIAVRACTLEPLLARIL